MMHPESPGQSVHGRSNTRWRALVRAALWGVVAVVLAAAIESAPRLLSVPSLWPVWRRVLSRSVAAALAWGVLSPVLWAAAGTLSQRRPGPRRFLWLAVVILLASAAEAAWSRWTYSSSRDFIDWWIARADRGLYTAIAIVAARMAADRLEKIARSTSGLFREQAALRHAELLRLDQQLQPHFLYNALNTVAELVHQNAAMASALINEIARLFHTMGSSANSQVKLREELASVAPFIAIQQARFGPRLTVDIAVPAEALEQWVPAMVLQPLVENAIRHGVESRPGNGTIRIGATMGKELILQVRNPTTEASRRRASGFGGIGLTNVRERLACLHGSNAALNLTADDQGLVTAEVRLPLRRAPLQLPSALDVELAPVGDGATARIELEVVSSKWYAFRIAVAAWLGVAVIWILLGALSASRAHTTLATATGGAATISQEIGLYLGLTMTAVFVLSSERLSRAPWPTLVAAESLIACAAFWGASHHIATTWATPAEQLLAAGLLEARLAAGVAILLAVTTWRWHLTHLSLAAETWEARALHQQLEIRARESMLDTTLIHSALTAIARTAPTSASNADGIAVALAESLRFALHEDGESNPLDLTERRRRSAAELRALIDQATPCPCILETIHE